MQGGIKILHSNQLLTKLQAIIQTVKIKFVNHASFIIESGEISLICDPWLEGTAFNNGWNHLSETKMAYSDFKGITHIWFSHEHPDHFSPPNLLKIPKEIRADITVLFQETTDGKVADFCRKIGFQNQVQLKENKVFEIGKDFSILCNPHTEGDSYALIKAGNFKILNLNDCIVKTEDDAAAIRKKTGEVDILFTQFGYANKIGNTDDVAWRQSLSDEKLQRIFIQNKYLKPALIVPFASFVYFCHEENKYMNEGMNKIDKVYTFIRNQLKAECLVMYPNDVWEPGQGTECSEAIQKYLDDYLKISSLKFLVSEPIPQLVLTENSRKFMQQIKNGFRWKTGVINDLNAVVFVSDYQKTFELSGKHGLVELSNASRPWDISLSSESLNYCFKELWGGDTLNVNARFQTGKNYFNFRVFGLIGASLNRKEKFPLPSFTDRLANKLKQWIK